MNLLNVMTLSNGRVQDKKFKSFKTNVWSSIKTMERRNFSQMILHFLTIWKILKRILSWQSKFNVFAGVPSYTFTPSPLDWNSPCRGASHQEVSTQARQQEEVVGASLLRPIRTNRSSYVNVKDLIRCWRN